MDGIASNPYLVPTSGVLGTSRPLLGYFDPRDSNQDGVVSPAEAFNYGLLHPAANVFQQLNAPTTGNDLFAPLKASRSNLYGPRGAADGYATGAQTGTGLDLFA